MISVNTNRNFTISLPFVDLRSDPREIVFRDYSHQALRETQLVFGEHVELIEERGEWFYVAAIEQPRFDVARGWHAYPGWIKRSEVIEVININLPQQNSPPNRMFIVENARHFLGTPYLWGGRSFPVKESISGVDCSGLINLLYRMQGMLIPRNAHDQFLQSQPTHHLQPADPLYLAKTERICHVILKLDEHTFIEAPETGKCIRLLHWGKDVWENKGKIHFFDRPHAYTPYPRSFLT